jgi:hypothetical protein
MNINLAILNKLGFELTTLRRPKTAKTSRLSPISHRWPPDTTS